MREQGELSFESWYFIETDPKNRKEQNIWDAQQMTYQKLAKNFWILENFQYLYSETAKSRHIFNMPERRNLD